MNIRFIGCAPRNFRTGRSNHQVEAVVIHLIDGSQVGCDATFLDNNLTDPRSAHYSISKSGVIHQYVDEQDTAFHSGRVVNPTWPGLKLGSDGRPVNPNLYTIGIEHEGRPNDEWPDEMYIASAALLRAIAERNPALSTLSERNVAMHRQIRADKSCPGFKFSLQRLLLEAGQSPPDVLSSPTAVRITTAVNLRLGRPTTKAPVVRVIAKDSLVNVVGHVTGDAVQGNNRWYRTLEDNFFWAGATDIPNPQ